jgi:eukaryotic-like serine/threonine-protein kinase
VSRAFNIGSAGFSASDVGSIAFHQIAARDSQLFWIDRTARKLRSLGEPADVRGGRLSKDETKLAIVLRDHKTATEDVWIQDVNRGTRSRLTSLSNILIGLAGFSPDGSQVLFSARTGAASRDLLQKAVSGQGKEELVLHGGSNAAPDDWAPDGKTIVYLQSDGATGSNLYLLPMEGERKPIPFASANGDQRNARFSPDGRWVAYESNESGRYEVYVQAVSGGTRVQVSVDGGTNPEWRRDGQELYFVSLSDRLMVSTTRLGASFEASVPTELFALPPNRSTSFLPSTDGQKFLIGETVTQNAPSPSTVILNWKPQ